MAASFAGQVLRRVPSAEGEAVRLGARVEELDLEEALGDGLWLPNELVLSLVGHRASALVVDI